MLAKDGKPFDIDILDELAEDEVEIIQFLRPNGKRRRMSCILNKELVKKTENMILSSEQLPTGKIAIYGRMVGQTDEKEYFQLADNGPGNNSPTNVLIKVINHVFETNK